ncbi:MAG: hypothetical protein EOP04_14505 [Proteobacteria bacterium]|nr:MAG: hypothetical protein EOP04_14505 [Pseudomonadota bacterium]
MTKAQQFILDVIQIVPDHILCWVQAPSLENTLFLSIFSDSGSWYRELLLSDLGKSKFSQLVEQPDVLDYFQSLEISVERKIIFKAYDGMEFGQFHKSVNLPVDFTAKYGEDEYLMAPFD